ncbi:sensor histidine kinase [Cohnella herbarum]|uniref:histidine kinase n=1 Tax=Cohnella herbarum TaxID=2728023 RepID=A0A7Z2ZJR3_9BACL|nr:sensor histidine kinase [Cohnella herbarum]QJD82040.1 sensor histidine kinase [Cohnella herbarum]
MNGFWRGVKKRLTWPADRMEGKLFVVFLFLIILPIGVLSYISAQRYTDSIERNTVTYVSQVSDLMISKLDDYMEDMKKISIIPSYLAEIKSGLKESNRYYESLPMKSKDIGTDLNAGRTALSDEQLQLLRRVEGSIYFLNNIKNGANTVYLFDRYGHSYFVTKSGGVRPDLKSVYPEWRKLAYDAHGYPVLVSTQEVSGNTTGSRYVFTIVREIIDTTYESLGLIAVDANIIVIENIVKDLDKATHGTTLIVDHTGRVVYDSEKKYLGQNMNPGDMLQASGEEGSFHTTIDGKHVLTIYEQSRNTGWKIFITIPEKELMGDALRIRGFTLVSAVLIIGFALLISLIFTFTLTKPLRSLVRMMKVVQTGNLDVTFPVRRRDEIGLVGSAFNRMIVRVKSLVEDVYMAGQRKKEAELEALQNQINPHFIYNTLESIRMTAVINDDVEVSDMTQLLGKLLRYGMGTGTEKVPLRMELEHLNMYMQLLNYRYGNRFVLEIVNVTDPDLPVMKLLFQPIVENALYHGMDESKPAMIIRLVHEQAGTDHLFTITDDGVGMSEADLTRLRRRLNEPKTAHENNGRGIGLRNVHERLKLLFGENYGISIESAVGAGTSVTVRLPRAMTKGDQ